MTVVALPGSDKRSAGTDTEVEAFLHPPARPPLGVITVVGSFFLFGGLGGFAAWADMAPLASAVVASGIIAVDTSRKTVQHVEGGSIAELLVRDGDRVDTGQVLLRLDDVEAKSLHGLLEGRVLALSAQDARLMAERETKSSLVFPGELVSQRRRADVAEILQGQQNIFDSSHIAFKGQSDVLKQRIAQFKAQEAGLQAQLAAGREQFAFIQSELTDVRSLHARGLERRPRLLALERTASKLKGDEGELANRIAQTRESVASIEFEILNLSSSRVEKATVEQRDVQSKLAEARERMTEARVRLQRREVVAPQAGIVLNSQFHNIGAVVGPGKKIVDIVPSEDKLVVEARVKPTDIESVRAGLPVRIAFTAYKSRTTHQVNGRVKQVSADALSDERTGLAHFLARIELDPDQLAKFPGIKPSAGMPVETFIETEERTLLAYLLQPLTDSFRRAFREQ